MVIIKCIRAFHKYLIPLTLYSLPYPSSSFPSQHDGGHREQKKEEVEDRQDRQGEQEIFIRDSEAPEADLPVGGVGLTGTTSHNASNIILLLLLPNT